MSQIDVKNLTKAVGDHMIIDDVTFSVNKGEYVGLIGPNGAGKSTLLRILIGIETYSSGTCVIDNDVRMGYVPQQYIFSEHMPLSVQEVIAMGIKRTFPHRIDYKEMCTVIRQVGLTERILRSNFHHLSGGQKQRVIIARAIINAPNVLLCDEPLSGVDQKSKEQIYELLASLNRENGMTIIFVSHEIETIIKRSDRVLCLNKKIFNGCHPIDFAKNNGTCVAVTEKDYTLVHHHHDNQ